MKKTHIIRLKELINRGWKINEQDGTIKNPVTGRTIKISTALGYKKDHPAYKLAVKQSGGNDKKQTQSDIPNVSDKSKEIINQVNDILSSGVFSIAGDFNSDVIPKIENNEQADELADYFSTEQEKLKSFEKEQKDTSWSVLDDAYGPYENTDIDANKRVPNPKDWEKNPMEAFKTFVNNAKEDGVTISKEQMNGLKDKVSRLQKAKEGKENMERKYGTEGDTAGGTLDSMIEKLQGNDFPISSKNESRNIKNYQEFTKKNPEGKFIPDDELQESLTQVSKFQMNEPDHEGEMAKSQMLKTMKYAADIMNMIDDTTELPAWVQSKLTKIADYIGAVKHYMDSKTVRHVVTNMMEEKEIKLADLVSTPMNEKVNEKQIIKDLESGMSMDAVIGKHANRATTNTDEIRKVIQKHMWNKRMKRESLSPDIAKHMVGIYKGFVKVEGDGTMIYDSPVTAKKAADYLNSKKIAASSDGKYLYIESVVKEGFVTIALGVAAGLLLLKVIKFLAKKLLVGISMNAPLDKEKLKDFLQKSVDTSLRQSGSLSGDTVLKVMLIQKHLNGQIDGGKIKTLKQLMSEVEKAVNGLTVKESVINEGPSSEELRLAKNAIKAFAKYRRVSDSDAYYDLMSALKSLERQYESVTEGKNDKEIKELEAKLKSVKGNTPADQGIKAAIKDDIERLKK